MKVFGEVKIPCEYMPDERPYIYLQHRVADAIVNELLNQNLIKITEEYKQGYYIMHGEVEVET